MKMKNRGFEISLISMSVLSLSIVSLISLSGVAFADDIPGTRVKKDNHVEVSAGAGVSSSNAGTTAAVQTDKLVASDHEVMGSLVML